jgi:hypothetical protein
VQPRLLLILLLVLPLWTVAGDRGADGRFSRRGSSHFQLLQDVAIERYSGPKGSRQFEIDVLEILEGAYRQVGDAIAIRPRTKMTVVVYDAADFDQRFGGQFGFRAAGFYDGSMHLRSGTRLDPALVGTLYHEYTHAALDYWSRGAFPAWLNEGLAEYMEARAQGRRYLTPGQNYALVTAAREGYWIPLRSLSTPSFAHMGGSSASLAYVESYAVIEHLARRDGERSLRDLVDTLGKTRNADRALKRTYHRSLEEIEANLLAELR